MAKGKYAAKNAKRFNTKALALILALVLMVGGVVGGTVAWLIDQSDKVVNTFTYGDINIDLDETDTKLDDDDDPDTNEYEMMPGSEITKDPKVTVKAGSENNWLFVKLEKSENFDDFLTYVIGDGWTQLYDAEGNQVEGVYYRYQAAIAEDGEDACYSVLKDDKVQVKGEVAKEQLNALDQDGRKDYPTLTVTAYAVQYAGFEPVITEGAEAPTEQQVNDAALGAWEKAVEAENTAENP